MVVALFALSLVMVVGGIAAVIQGFPYVRLESGLAMVIGGATAASAGTILLGLSAVVARLKRIEEALGDASSRTEAARPSEFAPLPDFGMSPPVAPPRLAAEESASAGAAGLAGLGAAGLGAGLRGSEPTFEHATPVIAANAPSEPPIEPLLPDLLPPHETPIPASAQPDPEPVAEAPAVPPGEDLFARPAADEDAYALRPSLKDGPSEADEPAEPPVPEAEPQEDKQDEPQVVGTYASGGNTYVMYSTGMIEADTPNGRFTFSSLDELKAFVDSGGENQARGAA